MFSYKSVLFIKVFASKFTRSSHQLIADSRESFITVESEDDPLTSNNSYMFIHLVTLS